VDFDRGHFISAMAGLIVGALLIVSLPTLATVGEPMLLGTKNTEQVVTKLNTRGGLKIVNFKSGNPALILEVPGGTPPMSVNSTTKVKKLNADLVDGSNARELRTEWGWRSEDNIANNAEWAASRTVTVPVGGGVILMSGAVDFYNSGASADLIECFFSIDGAQIHPSRMTVTVQVQQETTCNTHAAANLAAGTYTVRFETAGMIDSHLWAEDGFWYYLALPA